ncbi:DEAD/DEAH box helicase, partial [bacterium]|nr:DEAD/DEAH box helicase [bacterium]
MNFEELGLTAPLVRAVHKQGYVSPTPIQKLAVPHALAGRDVLACAQTGTGKTAAFALPILQLLHTATHRAGRRAPRVLVLAPTRELAAQIGESFREYGAHTGLSHTVIFGGVSQQAQVRALQNGVDILVATPGRLLDLMNQRLADLRAIEFFVLDEADRMLDMGFINDIRRVVKALPVKRQTMLFSATLPPAIRELAGGILIDPVSVAATPSATTVESIDQAVYFVEKPDKPQLLAQILARPDVTRAIVFTRTKHGADAVVRKLSRARIASAAIHGNKSQNNRVRTIEAFKYGKPYVLVATDIASRGLDIDQVSHVVNFDLPHEPEAYVHRIGRTGRAGESGIAISFCAAEERSDLAAIERLIRRELTVEKNHEFHSDAAPAKPAPKQARGPKSPRP